MRALLLVVRKSLSQHALSTVVTVLAAGLACGLVMSVFSIQRQARTAFQGEVTEFDAVLGPPGSPLQIVLNSLFHLEASPGTIPLSFVKRVEQDPRVERAVPISVGDNYRGFRVVGTTLGFFDQPKFRREDGSLRMPRGHRFFDETRREAVVGSFAAQETGLGPGDRFNPVHGFVEGGAVHPQVYLVTGVLEPTNTPDDRAIFIPIEGIYRMEGHVLRGGDERFVPKPGEPIPDDVKDVSAALLELRGNIVMKRQLQDEIRESRKGTLAWPIGSILAGFFDKLGWITRVLLLVAYLVVAVAAAAILASIYNTMNERRREFAILRSLGARRANVFAAIVAESATIGLLGALLGVVLHAAIFSGAAAVVRAQTGVVLELFRLHPVHWAAPLGMVLLGALAGLVPAWNAYRTDVAENLVPHS